MLMTDNRAARTIEALYLLVHKPHPYTSGEWRIDRSQCKRARQQMASENRGSRNRELLARG